MKVRLQDHSGLRKDARLSTVVAVIAIASMSPLRRWPLRLRLLARLLLLSL